MLESLKSLIWTEVDQQTLISDFIDEISDAIWHEDIAQIEKLRSHISDKNYIYVLFLAPYDVMRNTLVCDDSRMMLAIVAGLSLEEKLELFKQVVATVQASHFRKHAKAIKSLFSLADNHQYWLELLAVRMKNGQTPVYFAARQEDQNSLQLFAEGLSDADQCTLQLMRHSSSSELIFSELRPEPVISTLSQTEEDIPSSQGEHYQERRLETKKGSL